MKPTPYKFNSRSWTLPDSNASQCLSIENFCKGSRYPERGEFCKLYWWVSPEVMEGRIRWCFDTNYTEDVCQFIDFDYWIL